MSAVKSPDDVSPEEIAAIEKVLQHIDRQNTSKAVLAPLANWILALKIFKEMELRFACMADRSKIAPAHRATLSSLMAMGEFLLVASETLGESDFKSIHTSREAVTANVKYLRMKFAQWYEKRDPAYVSEINARIEAAKS